MEHPDLAFKPAHDHVEETPVVVEIESFRVLGLDPDDAEFYSNYPEAKRKKVVRKVGYSLLSPVYPDSYCRLADLDERSTFDSSRC